MAQQLAAVSRRATRPLPSWNGWIARKSSTGRCEQQDGEAGVGERLLVALDQLYELALGLGPGRHRLEDDGHLSVGAEIADHVVGRLQLAGERIARVAHQQPVDMQDERDRQRLALLASSSSVASR